MIRITESGILGAPHNAPAIRLSSGKVLIGWARGNGEIRSTEIDEKSGLVFSSLIGQVGADRHQNASFGELTDGRIVAVFGNHGSTVRMSITTDVGTSAGGWGPPISLPSTDMRYPKAIVTDEGSNGERIYIFHSHKSTGRVGRHIYTDDRGQTWSTPTVFFQNTSGSDWVYQTARKSASTGRIVCCVTDANPDSGSRPASAYVMIYDPATGEWRSAGGSVLSLPQTPSIETRIYYPPEHDDRHAAFIVAGYEAADGSIYVIFRSTHRTNGTSQVHWCKWDGASWVVRDVLPDETRKSRNALVMIDGEFNRFLVTLHEYEDVFDIYLAETPDDGDSWSLTNLSRGRTWSQNPAFFRYTPTAVEGGALSRSPLAMAMWDYSSDSSYDGEIFAFPYGIGFNASILRDEPEDDYSILYPEGFLDQTASELPPANNPPVFQTSPPTTVRAGEAYVYNGVVTDADGDPITITLEEGPDWLELTDHGDGTFTLEGTAPNE